MMISQASTPAAGGEDARIFVALELSDAKWLLAVQSPLSRKVSRHGLKSGDGVAVLRLIERERSKVAAKLGGCTVVSCYEAGRDGFWLHRLLSAQGVCNYVLDASSIHVDRRARRAKTDRLDAEQLVGTLMAYCRGERRVCRPVRVPSVAEEDARRLTRERERLLHERTAHLNRISGVLSCQGVRGVDPRKPGFAARLAALRSGDGGVLGARLIAELLREQERLLLVVAQVATVEAGMAQAQREATPQADKVRALQQLKGIGPIGAHVLVNEVFHRDFANRREVASYFGLAPSPFSSGGMNREQGISKAGNRRSRTMSIELAWLWRRWQPDSALSQWYEARTKGAGSRARRIAITALARKLMVALWRYLTTGLVPTGAVLRPAP